MLEMVLALLAVSAGAVISHQTYLYLKSKDFDLRYMDDMEIRNFLGRWPKTERNCPICGESINRLNIGMIISEEDRKPIIICNKEPCIADAVATVHRPEFENAYVEVN